MPLDATKINKNRLNLGVSLGVIMLFLWSVASAQITPPGMGDGCTNSWFAMGLNQRLSSRNKWVSKTNIGVGRCSEIDRRNPFQHQGMFIFSQAFGTTFKNNWEYGFGVSYRRKNKYKMSPSFSPADPAVVQEFRGQGEISYAITRSRLKLTPSLKQEVRKFYTPAFHTATKQVELRTRFRLKFALYIDKKKVHSLTVISEQLFPSSQLSDTKKWDNFGYSESRFSLFYSCSPSQLPLSFDIGYTNQLLGFHNAHSNHYFTIDVRLSNLFSMKKEG